MNFKTGIFALAICGLFAVGCGGNVCEDAAEICGSADGEDGSGECTGSAETLSQCIVDADSCTAETLIDCASQ